MPYVSFDIGMNQYTGGLSIYSDNVLLYFPYPFFLEFGVFSHVWGSLVDWFSFPWVFCWFGFGFLDKKTTALILTHNC